MATKTATICAGQQQNGTGDCVAFYNGLSTKNYTGQAYGNGGTPATAANFNDAKNRSVLYWSSHGRKTNTTNYEVLGNNWFSVGVQMANWTTSNPIEVAFFASCYAFYRDYYKRGFAGIMKRTNLFVVCGYSGQAPAGTSTDTNIVNSFFSFTNSGDGVVYAWKKGNNDVGTYPWGAISYGTISANMNFKMPGWGTNTGIDRTQSIWYINQSGASVISPLTISASYSDAESLPAVVFVKEAKIEDRMQNPRNISRSIQYKVTTREHMSEVLGLVEKTA